MVRTMRRNKQQITRDECDAILKREMRGVLAVNGDDGYPYDFPINYYYDSEAQKVYFHSAREGYKIDCLKNSPKVSFCVHDSGYRMSEDWAFYVTSIIMTGQIRFVEDQEEGKKYLKKIAEKYMPQEEEGRLDYDQQIQRVTMLEMSIETMQGKLVHEK